MDDKGGVSLWAFYIEGPELVVCFPRDSIIDLGEHCHLRLDGPMAFLLGGSLLHILQHDAEEGGELAAAIEAVLP